MYVASTKTAYAHSLNISRSMLYYHHKQPEKDWKLKQQIEEVMSTKPYHGYGHKRLATRLHIDKKRIRRVMKLYGIKPYRRRGRKYKKPKEKGVSFPNLLLTTSPQYPHHVWASDFTHISFHGRWVYLATVIDLYTREIVGFSVLTTHSVHLVVAALLSAIHKYPHPVILHSDHGSEYTSKNYVALCAELGITMSMSRKGCPWENGYQESWYDKFKIDMGDPNRFEMLGELVAELYATIHTYNATRIHTKLKMPPAMFAAQHQRSQELIELVS
jgi:putative transposase